MAKSKNNLSSLMKQLSSSSRGQSGTESGSYGRPPAADAKSVSVTHLSYVSEVAFGKPPRAAVATPTSHSSANTMTGLLHAVTGKSSGVASSLLGGGGLLGIGSLVSGLMGLFGGGKSSPPPLTPFEMPSSVQQELSVHANGVSPQAASGSGGAYGSLPGQTTNAQWLQQNSQQIASAVKTALLQSSSLADVINEL